MVFRSRFRMVASEGEGGIKKRTKFFIVFASLLCISAVYYVYSYSKQNTQLLNKQENLNTQVKTYSAVYKKCDRSLKTAKNDLNNFSKSNKQMAVKIASQEKEVADLHLSLEKTMKKLKGAFNFYLDVKVLLGKESTGRIEQEIVPYVADGFKTQIAQLKDVSVNYEHLKKSVFGLKGDFDNLTITYQKLSKRYQVLSGEAVHLREDNNRLQKINTEMSGKLTKLRKEMKNSPQTSVLGQVQGKIKEISKDMQKKIPTIAADLMNNLSKGLAKVGVIKDGKRGSKKVAGVRKSLKKQPELEKRISVEAAANPGEQNRRKTENNYQVAKGKAVDEVELDI